MTSKLTKNPSAVFENLTAKLPKNPFAKRAQTEGIDIVNKKVSEGEKKKSFIASNYFNLKKYKQ